MCARNSLLAALLALGRVGSFGSGRRPLQLALVAPTLADVAGDAEDLDEAAVGTQKRTRRDLGPHRRTVLAAMFQLTPESFEQTASGQAGAQALEIRVHDAQRIRRQHLFQGLLLRFVGGEAAQLLDRRADIGIAAIEIHRQDDVDGIVAEQAVTRLAQAQGLFGLHARSDVLDDEQIARRRLVIDL